MKVYVVSSGGYDGGGVDQIFAVREKAEEYAAPIEAARVRNYRTHSLGDALRNYAYNILGQDFPRIIRADEIQKRFNRGANEITCLGAFGDYIHVTEREVIE